MDFPEIPAGDDLRTLQDANREAITRLTNLGVGLDPTMGVNLMLDVLARYVTGNDPEQMREIALAYEQRLGQMLSAIQINVNRARLRAPGAGLHIPGR